MGMIDLQIYEEMCAIVRYTPQIYELFYIFLIICDVVCILNINLSQNIEMFKSYPTEGWRLTAAVFQIVKEHFEIKCYRIDAICR
jgi:hypothetical protein